MDDMRSSFSRFKKDIKHRLGRKKHKPDRVGVNPTEGRANSLDSLQQPDHRAAASGHGEEGTSTGVLQASSRDRSPQPKPTRADKGSDDLRRREAGGEKEAGQKYSHLDPATQVAGESGPNRGARSSQLSPSLPNKAEPEGT